MYAKQAQRGSDNMVTIICGPPQRKAQRGRTHRRGGPPMPTNLNLSQYVEHQLRRGRRICNIKDLGEKDGFMVVGSRRSLKAMAKGAGARTKVTNRFSALNDNKPKPVQGQRGPVVCAPRQPTGVWGARSSGLVAADAKKATVTLKKLLSIAPAPFAAEAAVAAAIAAECSKVKSAHFADDVGKTLTETRIFRSNDPSNVGDLIPVSDEKDLLHKSPNAWRRPPRAAARAAIARGLTLAQVQLDLEKALQAVAEAARHADPSFLASASAATLAYLGVDPLASVDCCEVSAALVSLPPPSVTKTMSWADLADEDDDDFWA